MGCCSIQRGPSESTDRLPEINRTFAIACCLWTIWFMFESMQGMKWPDWNEHKNIHPVTFTCVSHLGLCCRLQADRVVLKGVEWQKTSLKASQTITCSSQLQSTTKTTSNKVHNLEIPYHDVKIVSFSKAKSHKVYLRAFQAEWSWARGTSADKECPVQ